MRLLIIYTQIRLNEQSQRQKVSTTTLLVFVSFSTSSLLPTKLGAKNEKKKKMKPTILKCQSLQICRSTFRIHLLDKNLPAHSHVYLQTHNTLISNCSLNHINPTQSTARSFFFSPSLFLIRLESN